MYLLYLDESGNEDDAADRHFVLAGAAVFERQTWFLSQELDALQTKYFPGTQPLEFHASQIRSGTGFWRNLDRPARRALLRDMALAIGRSAGVALFAGAIEKSAALFGEEAVARATEEVCRRFDVFLMRKYHEEGDRQRGLLIFSEGRFDKRAKIWVREFRELGTRWGAIRNLSDIPYFASTRETRLLQVADFVAYAVYQLYERRDPELIAPILQRFHQRNGVIHGLAHHRAEVRTSCECPPCSSRKNPGSVGSWM